MLLLKEKHEYEDEIKRLKIDVYRLHGQIAERDRIMKSKCSALAISNKRLTSSRNKNIALIDKIKQVRELFKGVR